MKNKDKLLASVIPVDESTWMCIYFKRDVLDKLRELTEEILKLPVELK